MENGKMPFVPDEAIRTQRVEVYLSDLKKRLQELRSQHDVVIQKSVQIINEIDVVSSTLVVKNTTEKSTNENITKIKKLIQEFENVAESSSTAKLTVAGGENKVNIQNILNNFDKLSESNVLNESLMLFRRAKESFQKIDNFLTKTEENGQPSAGSSSPSVRGGMSINLRNKINMFNAASGAKTDSSPYASCCSLTSLDTFHSMEQIGGFMQHNVVSNTNSLENGYDGDNDDSEYDLLAIKPKKNKCPMPTSTDTVQTGI